MRQNLEPTPSWASRVMLGKLHSPHPQHLVSSDEISAQQLVGATKTWLPSPSPKKLFHVFPSFHLFSK